MSTVLYTKPDMILTSALSQSLNRQSGVVLGSGDSTSINFQEHR